jgi:hypothetical protein
MFKTSFLKYYISFYISGYAEPEPSTKAEPEPEPASASTPTIITSLVLSLLATALV